MGFTLDTIRQEAEKRYGAFEIDDAPGGTLKLRAALRLNDEDLTTYQKLTDTLKELDEDAAAVAEASRTIVDILALTADRPDDWREYATQLDRADLLYIYETWAQGTQAGEASP